MPSIQTVQAVDKQVENIAETTQPTLSLHEMSRIMDVASALRKERSIAELQLNLDETKAMLREKLLETTKITGEKLTPEEVDAAIEQFYDNLYSFEEPEQSISVVLAHLYVRRATITKWLLGIAGAVVLFFVWTGWAGARDARQAENLWRDSVQHSKAIVEMADDKKLSVELNSLVSNAALARDKLDFNRLQEIKAELARIRELYESEYQVLIVAAPGERSGTQREYTDDQGTRTSGFYVFVEARNTDGSLRPMQIRNRETGNTETVKRWGEQVPESVFNRLADDKQADGVLDERLFAVKKRGDKQFEVQLEGDADGPLRRGGQITSW